MPLDVAAIASIVVETFLSTMFERLVGAGSQRLKRQLGSGKPLEKPLRGALEEACSGFAETIHVGFGQSPVLDARLQEMMGDERFLEALGELPYMPFDEINTSGCRDLFLLLGLPNAVEADFDAAWRNLGRRFSSAAAASTELTNLININSIKRQDQRLARLEELLQWLKDKYPPIPDGGAALAAYRQFLYERYRWADTTGLFLREREGAGEAIALQDVFVETFLKRAPRKPAESSMPANAAEHKRLDGPSSLIEPSDALANRRRVADVLTHQRLTVILGPPGSGKSTLMRCLAMALCRPEAAVELLATGLPPDTVPLLFELKIYASALRQQPALRLDELLLKDFKGQLPNVGKLLDSGRAVVLLDGFDEVFDEDHRRWVSEEVWRVATRFQRTRFVLTSRPLGYRVAPLPGPVRPWWIATFDDRQIAAFFRGWFEALAREGIKIREQTPAERASRLVADVLDRERIREMARNPMLCTLIVMVHRARAGDLPQHRFVFYEAAVATLVEFWQKAKYSPKPERRYLFPDPVLVTRALADVAWRAFRELKSREIPDAEIRRWLAGSFGDDPEWGGPQGRRAVADFLKLVRERTGLLVDAGAGRYQFVHLSLHEYLVAKHVLDRMSEAEAAKVLRHYLHAPQWKEVLQLLVVGAPEARAEALVRQVLRRPSSEWEELLRRDLRFVCRCLGDRATIGRALRREIYAQAQKALTDPDVIDWWGLARDAAYAGAPAAIPAVRGQLSNVKAARLLAEIGAGDDATRMAVERRLGDPDLQVHLEAVNYFVKLGPDDSAIRTAFSARLDSDDPEVRLVGVQYFAGLAKTDEETRADFTSRLGDDDVRVRYAAVEYFIGLAAKAPEIPRPDAAIAARLEDERGRVRYAAMEYFATTGATDPAIRRAIAERLRDYERRVRMPAVVFFNRYGTEDAQIRNAIASRLADDYEDVRRVAVEYFATLGLDDPEIRNAFMARLDDHDGRLRRAAVRYFVALGIDEPEIRGAVTKLLDDKEGRVCRGAIDYFIRIGAGDRQTREAIATKLEDSNSSVRYLAAEYFARLDNAPGTPDYRADFVTRLSSEDPVQRHTAVEFFVRAGFDAALCRDILSAFEAVSADTSAVADQLISEGLGQAAAAAPGLMRELLEKARRIRFFQLDRCLTAAALEHDRLCRQKEEPGSSPGSHGSG